MAFSFHHISRVLTKHRNIPLLDRAEKHYRFLSPLDWAVISVLGLIMAGSVFALVATVSLKLAENVPTHGGTYIEGVVGAPRFINPLLAVSDADHDLVKLIYSGLLAQKPDGSLTLDLASDYSISDDKRTYTVTLKDTTFHDGKPVTSADVLYTIHEAVNPEIKSPRRPNWEGVEVSTPDPKTIVFTLKSPYAPFLENLTLGIMPEHLWKSVTADEFQFSTLNANPVGSGPFYIDAIKRTGSGTPTEYDLRSFSHAVTQPFIDRFIVKFYSNPESLRDALNSGVIVGAHSITPTEITSGHQVIEAVYGRVFGIFFNQNQNKVFADANVRKALNAVLDKQSIVDTVLGGYGSVIDGPLPPETITSSDVARESKESRLERAKALLEKSGWKMGADGVYAKTVKKEVTRLSFSLSTASVPELKRAAELAADDWKALGADVTLKFFDQNDLNIGVLRPRKYDALLFGLVVGKNQDLFAFWHSSQRNDPGLNIALYANIDVDKKLDAARVESDSDKRIALTEAAAKEISDDTAAIFLYSPYFVYATPTSVKGIELGTIQSPADRLASVSEWYLYSEQEWPIFSMSWSDILSSIHL